VPIDEVCIEIWGSDTEAIQLAPHFEEQDRPIA
jgi:hypothetical protein